MLNVTNSNKLICLFIKLFLFQTPVEKPRQLSRVSSTASSIADALSMYSEGSGATSENSPIVRENIVREEDNNEIEHLPAQGNYDQNGST